MGKKTVLDWDAAERLANDLERRGQRITGMSEERNGIRVTWTVGKNEEHPHGPDPLDP